jgi:hypothetical protein
VETQIHFAKVHHLYIARKWFLSMLHQQLVIHLKRKMN